MTYIHEPDRPPQLEKTIVVSILISSEFLQMETLVEHCLLFIANTLNEVNHLLLLLLLLLMAITPLVYCIQDDDNDE